MNQTNLCNSHFCSYLRQSGNVDGEQDGKPRRCYLVKISVKAERSRVGEAAPFLASQCVTDTGTVRPPSPSSEQPAEAKPYLRYEKAVVPVGRQAGTEASGRQWEAG